MYPTKELRWFFKEDVVFIRKWFEQNHKMTFSKTQSRDDYYLPQPGKKDNGIKLRERNIEVKTLHGRQKTKIGKNAGGYLEDWKKWRFELKPSDELARQIIEKNKYNWLKTTKTRMGFKMVKNRRGVEIRDIKEELENGCQAEYTRLKIKNDTWYSFAVETFGSPKINLYGQILNEIALSLTLLLKDSMGYPEFLDKYYFNRKTE